ncbi:MAG: hypothetical protein KDC80_07140 [Saprospiraceae bacterium]|nr:hypothetical protein [Saprospiraceae bacterium]
MNQDQTGYNWVGGVAGLYRFDGNEFYHFPSEDEDIWSLQAGIISYIYEDLDEKLWIAPLHNGLKDLDRISGEFTHYRVDTSNHQELSVSPRVYDRRLRSYEEDNEGFLWIGTDRGLFRFDPKTEHFQKYDHSDGLAEHNFLWDRSTKIQVQPTDIWYERWHAGLSAPEFQTKYIHPFGGNL